jgi:hypothetical protein
MAVGDKDPQLSSFSKEDSFTHIIYYTMLWEAIKKANKLLQLF